jgi:hypothetical protein
MTLSPQIRGSSIGSENEEAIADETNVPETEV